MRSFAPLDLRLPLGFARASRQARETRVLHWHGAGYSRFGEDGLRLLWTTGSSLRPRHSARREPLRRAFAGGLRPCRKERRPRRGRDSLLHRPRSAARLTTWTHRILRATELPGARCVTVRNLELIEPLFAGTDSGVTLFRCLDATVTPMGKRLLRTWMLRRLDQPRSKQLDSVAAQVRHDAREELRRALDGILDLERLLSRVTLETANPRDVLALAASRLVFQGANVLAGLAAPRLAHCMARSTNSATCVSESTARSFQSLR